MTSSSFWGIPRICNTTSMFQVRPGISLQWDVLHKTSKSSFLSDAPASTGSFRCRVVILLRANSNVWAPQNILKSDIGNIYIKNRRKWLEREVQTLNLDDLWKYFSDLREGERERCIIIPVHFCSLKHSSLSFESLNFKLDPVNVTTWKKICKIPHYYMFFFLCHSVCASSENVGNQSVSLFVFLQLRPWGTWFQIWQVSGKQLY